MTTRRTPTFKTRITHVYEKSDWHRYYRNIVARGTWALKFSFVLHSQIDAIRLFRNGFPSGVLWAENNTDIGSQSIRIPTVNNNSTVNPYVCQGIKLAFRPVNRTTVSPRRVNNRYFWSSSKFVFNISPSAPLPTASIFTKHISSESLARSFTWMFFSLFLQRRQRFILKIGYKFLFSTSFNLFFRDTRAKIDLNSIYARHSIKTVYVFPSNARRVLSRNSVENQKNSILHNSRYKRVRIVDRKERFTRKRSVQRNPVRFFVEFSKIKETGRYKTNVS